MIAVGGDGTLHEVFVCVECLHNHLKNILNFPTIDIWSAYGYRAEDIFILNMQVVNGFFWKRSPVRALDQGPDHSTVLGVSAHVPY